MVVGLGVSVGEASWGSSVGGGSSGSSTGGVCVVEGAGGYEVSDSLGGEVDGSSGGGGVEGGRGSAVGRGRISVDGAASDEADELFFEWPFIPSDPQLTFLSPHPPETCGSFSFPEDFPPDVEGDEERPGMDGIDMVDSDGMLGIGMAGNPGRDGIPGREGMAGREGIVGWERYELTPNVT